MEQIPFTLTKQTTRFKMGYVFRYNTSRQDEYCQSYRCYTTLIVKIRAKYEKIEPIMFGFVLCFDVDWQVCARQLLHTCPNYYSFSVRWAKHNITNATTLGVEYQCYFLALYLSRFENFALVGKSVARASTLPT